MSLKPSLNYVNRHLGAIQEDRTFLVRKSLVTDEATSDAMAVVLVPDEQ